MGKLFIFLQIIGFSLGKWTVRPDASNDVAKQTSADDSGDFEYYDGEDKDSDEKILEDLKGAENGSQSLLAGMGKFADGVVDSLKKTVQEEFTVSQAELQEQMETSSPLEMFMEAEKIKKEVIVDEQADRTTTTTARPKTTKNQFKLL